MTKKLPIGITSFEKIRKEDYIYIDKTKQIFELIENGFPVHNYLLLPEKIGKTLLIDTLQNLYEGRKELFKGLYIYDKWDFNKKYIVVRINFAFNPP